MQMYKMTKQQEEQHTPTFVRMQQQAAAKEAEEAAEKKRIWEEEVASKKFWVNSCLPHCLPELFFPHRNRIAMLPRHMLAIPQAFLILGAQHKQDVPLKVATFFCVVNSLSSPHTHCCWSD